MQRGDKLILETPLDIDKVLLSAIRRYYTQTKILIDDIPHREFGYSYDRSRKIQTRHKSFATQKDLQTFLQKDPPYYISYSIAGYRLPSAKDFSNKGLLYVDWVFEFDMEQLMPEDILVCESCKTFYFGDEFLSRPRKCPKCNKDLKIYQIPNPNRFRIAKRNTSKLIKILTDEFGIPKQNISINYSGNRGFHIHIRDEEWGQMPKEAREEIAHYILADLVQPEYIVQIVDGRPALYTFGLPGRIFQVVARKISYEILGDIAILNTDIKTAYHEIEKALPLISIPIDISTTMDIHRLIRVPDSVHGGTGLIAKTIDDLSEFNPYSDAVLPINTRVETKVRYLPKISWAGETYGPYENETVELPVTLLFFLTQK